MGIRVDFAKLNGLGNDFVMIDNMDGAVSLDPDQVAWLCDRHFGIGGDGVILVEQPREEGCDAYMNYINSDGTYAQMCGNGVRCFAKFLVDRKIVDPSPGRLVAGTMAGPKPISFTLGEDGALELATVDMGAPILDPEQVPTLLSASGTSPDGTPCALDVEIGSPWGDFAFTAVSMGNPHAVCFIEDWDSLPDELFVSDVKSLGTFDVSKVGAFFESNKEFPEKANIEFAETGPDGIHMRVFERGCGETLACGTGACATCVAAALTGRASRRSTIHLLGGPLDIEWSENGHVMMAGPAAQSFEGCVEVA